MIDVTKLKFYSGYPIDKIFKQDTVSFTRASGVPVSFGLAPNTLQTIPNTYGVKGLVVASWSIDGVNFNSTLDTLEYFSATFLSPILKASVNVGCEDSNIYFWLVNNFTSSLTYTINYSIYSIS